MKDLYFGISMLLAGIFCAIVDIDALTWVGGILVAIGVVVAVVAEFGEGIKKDSDDKET